MRGSRYALAALLALSACGGDDPATPTATSAPPTTAVPTTPSEPPSESPEPAPTGRATAREVEFTLYEAAVAEESYASDHGTYTDDVEKLYVEGLDRDPRIAVDVVSASKAAYCIAATGGGVTRYYSSSTGKLSETPCL